MSNDEYRMSSQNKAASLVFVGVVFLFLFPIGGFAEALPSAEDINNLAEEAKLTVDTFMQESFRLRMRYEYGGQFSDLNDRDNLYKLAKRASDRLQTIADEQRELKRQIEGYEGEDWDGRYGLTGLWRKLFADLYTTTLNKCEIDFYLALSSPQPEKDEILRDILAKINSLNQINRSAYLQFLKARTLALLSQTEPAYKQLAKKGFDELMVRSDMRHSTVFKIAVEKIKLLGPTKVEQVERLAEELAQSDCGGDFELVLPVVFLQRRFSAAGFEKAVQTWPETEDFLGELILSDLSNRFEQGPLTEENLQQVSILEAELATQFAWRGGTEDCKELLAYLSNAKKFQSPLILYVAAVGFADSSPAKAVNLLIKAGKLQKIKASERLNVEPGKIAEQATQLAYNLLTQSSGNCPLALTAFGNYCAIADDKVDEELEYLYSVVLSDCGQAEKSRKLLQKIADRPAGSYRDRAKLELTVYAIREKRYEGAGQKNKLVKQFSDLITSCSACEYSGEAMELLSEIIDEIEQVESQTEDLPEMSRAYKRLAEFCFGCLDGAARWQAGLYLAEVSIFAANKEKGKLLAVEELLSDIAESSVGEDVDLLRCRARLLAEQGEFVEAAGLWSQICKIRKSEAVPTNQRSWKWWRAKFYELYCWAECPQTKKADIYHTIEVLENSFTDIPPLWAEKLNSLKQQCLR